MPTSPRGLLIQLGQSCVDHFLQTHEDAQLGMIPGEAALKIDGVGLPDGAVGGELNRGALDEGTGGHNDLVVIPRHIPGEGGGEGIHWGGSLDAFAEGNHGLLTAQLYGLDDVVAGFRGVGDAFEAQRLIQIRRKDGTLFRTGGYRGGQEEALEQVLHEAQICAHLLSQAGGGEPVGAAGDALGSAADIAADGGQAAAGVLDERTDDHVRAHVRRLHGLYEFAVAVVHHDGYIRLALLAEGDELADLGHGEGGPGGVALGALDGDELGLFIDGGPNAVVVECAAWQQVHLPVADTVLLQRAGAFPDADDLLQCVVGHPHRGQQLISRQQVGAEGYGQGVGAAGDLGPDQGGLRMEYVRIDLFQGIPAQVVVAVAGGGCEAGSGNPILPHGI